MIFKFILVVALDLLGLFADVVTQRVVLDPAFVNTCWPLEVFVSINDMFRGILVETVLPPPVVDVELILEEFTFANCDFVSINFCWPLAASAILKDMVDKFPDVVTSCGEFCLTMLIVGPIFILCVV